MDLESAAHFETKNTEIDKAKQALDRELSAHRAPEVRDGRTNVERFNDLAARFEAVSPESVRTGDKRLSGVPVGDFFVNIGGLYLSRGGRGIHHDLYCNHLSVTWARSVQLPSGERMQSNTFFEEGVGLRACERLDELSQLPGDAPKPEAQPISTPEMLDLMEQSFDVVEAVLVAQAAASSGS